MMSIRLAGRTFVIGLCALVAVLGASAQYNLPKQARVDDGKMKTEFVKTGLYVISGQGSNSVLRLSANGKKMRDRILRPVILRPTKLHRT